MKLRANTLCVLELDGNRLCAISAHVSGTTAEVKRWLSVDRPESVAADDADAMGRWAGEELRKAGLDTGPTVISVSRGDVVLRNLSLPKPKEGGEEDLGAMVRLQMARQLALPIESTSIDYAPVPAAAGSTTLPVIAGAMPTNRVLWCRAFAKSAGLKLKRIELRCFGVAALLGPLSQSRDGTMLGVAVGWGSTELVIVEDGQMAFARSVDLPRPGSVSEQDVFADKVAVEVKRAWIGYRATRPGPVPDLVCVLGEGEMIRRVGDRCAGELQSTARVVALPASIKLPREMPEMERAAAAPLMGLLAQAVSGRPTLDFANPRRPVDRAAKARQMALAAVFGALVVGGAIFTVAKQRLESVEAEITAVEDERNELTKEYNAFLAQHARLSHLQTWQSGRVDWLAHVNLLCGQVPQGGVAYAEEIRGHADSRVSFVPSSKGTAYPSGEWRLSPLAMFDFKGRSPGRGVATDMRARLLDGDLYGVEIVGPDVTDRFALQLRTGRLTPMPPPAPGKGKDEGTKAESIKGEGKKEDGAKGEPASANAAPPPEPSVAGVEKGGRP